MPVVRELLSREELRVRDVSSDRSAMVTGKITVELLSACCRLVDLLANPQDIPYLGGLSQREIIYRLLCGPEGARLRAIATSGDQSHRTARAISWIRDNYAKPVRVNDLAEIGLRSAGHAPSANAAPCVSLHVVASLSFTAQPSTLPEETMRPCLPTRFLASTVSNPAIAPLCFKSAPHSSRQPSNLPVMSTAAARTSSARTQCASPRAQLAVSPIRPPR